MRFLGFDLKRTGNLPPSGSLVGVRSGLPWVHEPYTGAWQKNDEWTVETVLSHPVVFACISQISNDIGKLRIKLMEIDGGTWKETTDKVISPLLKRPNRYQNHIQFKQWWIMSKLTSGNTFVLKERDDLGNVVALYVMNPLNTEVLVSPDGSVYYKFSRDDLNSNSGFSGITVPASEVIHDRMNPIFHPLMGVSPLFASGLSASLGLKINSDSMNFFSNGASPGGILTAPGAISDETAARFKQSWTTNHGGKNSGKIAIFGDGLKYEPMRMSSVDSQTTELCSSLASHICTAFHMPAYLVGAGPVPSGKKSGELKQDYYDGCLHVLIEELELCIDDGVGLDAGRGTQLDLDALLRMDEATQIQMITSAIGGSLFTINDGRARLGLSPLDGGDTVYMQQQDFPLEQVKSNKLPSTTTAAVPVEGFPQDDSLKSNEVKSLIDYFDKRLRNEC